MLLSPTLSSHFVAKRGSLPPVNSTNFLCFKSLFASALRKFYSTENSEEPKSSRRKLVVEGFTQNFLQKRRVFWSDKTNRPPKRGLTP